MFKWFWTIFSLGTPVSKSLPWGSLGKWKVQVKNTVLTKTFMRSPLVLIGKKSTNVKRGRVWRDAGLRFSALVYRGQRVRVCAVLLLINIYEGPGKLVRLAAGHVMHSQGTLPRGANFVKLVSLSTKKCKKSTFAYNDNSFVPNCAMEIGFRYGGYCFRLSVFAYNGSMESEQGAQGKKMRLFVTRLLQKLRSLAWLNCRIPGPSRPTKYSI